MALSPLLRPVPFDALPGWYDDDKSGAFEAFGRSAWHVLASPYKSGALGIDFGAFTEAFEAARQASPFTPDEARAFFQTYFVPMQVTPEVGGQGFVTGFYEPEAEASPVRTARFAVPLLARPADLADIDDRNRPAGFDPYLAFGRTTRSGIVEYFDRPAIERGALAGKGLEIAWLEDKVDVFFIHVQGAARLKMTDGTLRRVTYAAKSGQRFTGPGHILADLGEIPLAEVTMQSIRRWLRNNPARIDEILWQNRSFIFFREAPVDDVALGPVAAAKVPLTPGRSIAVDRLLHTFGTPFYIDAPSLTAFDGDPFRRLMIAQDTGSAITGPARGDLFAGSGAAAGEIAGVVRHPADFYALVPRRLAGGQAG
jgi:membrane-bound lytic murein transglycosylase A